MRKGRNKLKEIRKLKGKPFHKIEILEHEKRYESVMRQRMAELKETRMRKVANVDYDPRKYQNKMNQKVFREDEIKRKEQLQRLNQKRLLAEKKMSYGAFVNQVHKPIISAKKVQEMENNMDKLKHPIKESRKIPSSASYHDLYNLKGDNPWNSKSQL